MAWISRSRGWLALAAVFVLWDRAAADCNPQSITTLSQLSLPPFSGCNTLNGSLDVDTISVRGSTVTLNIPFQQVMGTLRIANIDVQSGTATPGLLYIDTHSLKDVSTGLIFENLHLASMPNLSALEQTANLTFSNVTFGTLGEVTSGGSSGGTSSGGQIEYSYLGFSSMTFQNCAGLEKINVSSLATDLQSPASLTVTGNQALTDVSVSGYKDVQTSVSITGAGPVSVTLPDLMMAELRLSMVGNFSAPVLTQLGFDGTITQQSIDDCTMDSFMLPNLNSITNGAMNITRNMYLSTISLPKLTSVSTLNVWDNTPPLTIDMPALASVDSVFVAGDIQSMNYPDKISISNQFTVEPEDESVCSSLPKPGSSYSCQTSNSANPQPSSGNSSTSKSSGSGGLSEGAKIGIGVGVGVGGLLIIAALAFCLLRRRKSSKAGTPRSPSSKEYWTSEAEKVDRSPVRYSKVPDATDNQEESSRHSHGERPVSRGLPYDTVPSPPVAEQPIRSPDGRVELEEQQGPRHEMDARSLPDIDLDGDDAEDTRSLQDIERAHGHG